jgi:hypothetical protein
MSQLPEVQTAIRALDGVTGAFVRWPDPDGPATLHVRFADGADKQAVSGRIAAILSDVGGVDLQDVQPDVGPRSGSTRGRAARGRGVPHRPGRPALAGISVDQQGLDAAVDVTLRCDGRTVTGSAEGLASAHTAPRTAAAATVVALREVLSDDVRLDLEWLRVVDGEERGAQAVVHAAVTMLSHAGEEVLLGSAWVRGGVEEAAARATLCALNRRLEQLLATP